MGTTHNGEMPLHTPPRDCSPENDYLHARLNSPDDYSLAELLDSFYHHFGISDYLDQIGIIDDRITNIMNSIHDFQLNHDLVNDDQINDIENSIDNDFDGG